MANVDQANIDGDIPGDACDTCLTAADASLCDEPPPQNVCGDSGVPIEQRDCTTDADCAPTDPRFVGGFCGDDVSGVGRRFCVQFAADNACDVEAFCSVENLGSECPQDVEKQELCNYGRCCYEKVNCSLEFNDVCTTGTNEGCESGLVCGATPGVSRGGCACLDPGPAPPKLDTAPPTPTPVSGCSVDTDCPEGEACLIPEGASAGKCSGTPTPIPGGEPGTIGEFCGNCLLDEGEACEPHAVAGGPGACPEGTTCAEDCSTCVPVEPEPEMDPCIAFNSVSCDAGSGVIRTDSLPEEIVAALGATPTCDSLYLGSCAEAPGGFNCCSPGVCGDLSSLETSPNCGLLELVLNAGNPEPQSGDAYCGQLLSGSCNQDNCCEPGGGGGADFCDPSWCTASPGCISAPNGAEVCAVPTDVCPDIGPGVGIDCSVPGQDECSGLADVIGPSTCTNGCCIPDGASDPCGDRVCDGRGGEDCLTCELDCGPCPPPPP